jgi:hypothetical protein
MDVEASEALQRLLDVASAHAVRRAARDIGADDVLAAAGALAAAPPGPPASPVERRSLGVGGPLLLALSRAGGAAVRERSFVLDVPEVLGELGADRAVANAAVARLAAWVAADPPSEVHCRAMLVSVSPA